MLVLLKILRTDKMHDTFQGFMESLKKYWSKIYEKLAKFPPWMAGRVMCILFNS